MKAIVFVGKRGDADPEVDIGSHTRTYNILCNLDLIQSQPCIRRLISPNFQIPFILEMRSCSEPF